MIPERQTRRQNQRRFAQWLAILTLSMATLLGLPAQPRAQSSLLTGVAAAEASPGETRLLLTFSPSAPIYSIINNDSEHPAIAFARTSRGDGATAPSGLHGLLRSIDFDQNQGVLILNLGALSQAHMTAAAVGDKTISLTVSSGAARLDFGAPPATGGGLPAATVREPGQDGFELVPLKYADVSEVVGLLTDGLTIKPNDSFIPREPAFGSAGMGGGGVFSPQPAPNVDAANQPMGQSVNDAIGVDRRLNAIILRGSPERIAQLKARIALIDVPVESVILETVFVELSETGARNVGLDFTNANSQIAVATFQTGAFIPAGFPAGKGLSSVSLQTAIYAQVQAGRGRIVSKPRISAQSGSTAKIITGDALPILTAITLSGVNGVSQQVQYVNVGVTLQIAPRVSSDGYVTSHVFGVVSSVTGFSQGYPTISQREADTSVTVRDGETFVIGGLTEENSITTDTRVPLLGSVPLLGETFKLNKGTQSKRDLYIVVTPHVVRRPGPTPAEGSAGPGLDAPEPR
ncbi:MAG TPA: secretin N-terminal domain-containing protein [Caulobacteraceae bacterium]